MPTVEIDEFTEKQLKGAVEDGIRQTLYRATHEFIDISDVNTPPNVRRFVHTLSGRILTVTATWQDDRAPGAAERSEHPS